MNRQNQAPTVVTNGMKLSIAAQPKQEELKRNDEQKMLVLLLLHQQDLFSAKSVRALRFTGSGFVKPAACLREISQIFMDHSGHTIVFTFLF